MELHCLPNETPTTASSCSTDPLYDNCPPFAQRGRGKGVVESGDVRAAVTRLPGSCSPLTALAPAEVPTVVSEEGGAGLGPDHSSCSWREGLGRQGPQGARGGERGHGGCWGAEDHQQSPAPSHQSALSLYDNLPDAAAATPDSPRELAEMGDGFQEDPPELMHQAWAPGRLQGLRDEEGVSDYNSIWSSCEIVLDDQDREHQEEGHLGWVQTSPPRRETAAGSPQASHAEWPPAGVRHPENPRVPPPVPPADPSASALRSLLTSLQQQIIKQREEYETRILSLEHRNEELQVEVFQLKANLAQQRRWYQAVQAKIAESERGRAAAERRNATLQREMEQFFDTFGELNNEAKKTEWIVKSF